MLTTFEQIYAELRSRGSRKRMVAAWGVDGHTVAAAGKAVGLGLADVTLVGDETDKEVSQIMKVSRRTLQEYRNAMTLPYIHLGGKVLYREQDIQKLLADNYKKPINHNTT